MIVSGIVLIIIISAIIYKYKEKNKRIKKQKLEALRNSFREQFPETDEKFSFLLNTIGKDKKYSIYRKESSKVFNEILRVFVNIVEANRRLAKLEKLRENLLLTLDNQDLHSRLKEGVEKSKELTERINQNSDELKAYINNANGEIKASGIDFVHVATEIELAKNSDQLIDLTKLSTRSQNLSYIASNMPLLDGYTGF